MRIADRVRFVPKLKEQVIWKSHLSSRGHRGLSKTKHEGQFITWLFPVQKLPHTEEAVWIRGHKKWLMTYLLKLITEQTTFKSAKKPSLERALGGRTQVQPYTTSVFHRWELSLGVPDNQHRQQQLPTTTTRAHIIIAMNSINHQPADDDESLLP